MEQLERWHIIGDGLSYVVAVVSSTRPLSVQDILKICHCQDAVITVTDALTSEFLGMVYCSAARPTLEVVRYRRKGDKQPYGNASRIPEPS